jgi:hypothetical protein
MVYPAALNLWRRDIENRKANGANTKPTGELAGKKHLTAFFSKIVSKTPV